MRTMIGPLHGIRVVECASAACPLPLRLAISFTARLAAGLDAAVGKIGSPQDDPVQSIGPFVGKTGALSAFLDVGKSWIPAGDLAQGLRQLPGPPDIVLCDEPVLAQSGGCADMAVRTVFSMFAPGVAHAEAAASEFTIMAATGLLDLVGDPQREPLRLGGHQLAYACGLAAYAGSVAALCAPGQGAAKEIVRVSLADVAVWLNWKSVAMASWSTAGRARLGRDAEWQVVRCADGWVALVFLEADWPVLRAWVDDPALFDPRYDNRAERRKHARAVSERIENAFIRYTRRELQQIALQRRLPLGPVWTPIELETDPQNIARGFLSRQPRGGAGAALLMPRLPVLWNDQALGAELPA